MDFKKLEGYRGRPLDRVSEYAVNLPLIMVDGEWHFLFEVRAFKNISQAGEICLPGGRVEKDEKFYEACVRETVEELGIGEDKIDFISEMDYAINPMYRVIRPFLTVLNIGSLDELNINPDEVAEVFTVPVDFFRFTETEDYLVKNVIEVSEDFPLSSIPGGRDYPWHSGELEVTFYRYKDRIIWGLTARIVKRSVRILEELGVFN